MTQQQMYVKRWQQGLTRTPRAAKRILCVSRPEWLDGRPIYRQAVLPSDVLTPQQLRQIAEAQS